MGQAEESFLSGVAPMDAPPVVVARAGASLRKALGGAWSALFFLFAVNAALIFVLVYRRKSAWLLAKPSLARWLEISIVSILTIVVALPAMIFPEF